MRPMTLLCSLLLLCLIAAVAAQAKPEPPLQIELGFKGQPSPGKPATVIITVSSQIDQPRVKLALELPHGIRLAQEGTLLSWAFDLQADEAKQIAVRVMVDDAGEYQLAGRLATMLSGKLLRMNKVLYLVIDGDVSVSTTTAMNAAKREAIIARYRRANKLAADAEIDENELPEDVQAELDDLNRAEHETLTGAGGGHDAPAPENEQPDQPQQ